MKKSYIIECKKCKYYKKGYCKLKDMKVSINASFCKEYKKNFITKLIDKLK